MPSDDVQPDTSDKPKTKRAMKKQNALKPGLTLIELTVVIVVLLSLIGVLFVGATAWKNGSNRATCIVNIRNFQQAMRSYTNLHSDQLTAETDALGAATGNTSISIGDLITRSFIEGTGTAPSATCPLDGDAYTFGTTVPAVGSAWATCANATSDEHAPSDTGGW